MLVQLQLLWQSSCLWLTFKWSCSHLYQLCLLPGSCNAKEGLTASESAAISMAQVLEQCKPVEAWRSFSRSSPLWQQSGVMLVAEGILGLMPTMAIEVIKTGSCCSPKMLAKLDDPLKGAKRGDLIRNYIFLKPLQKAYPKAVPSSFFIADCIWALWASNCLDPSQAQPGAQRSRHP